MSNQPAARKPLDHAVAGCETPPSPRFDLVWRSARASEATGMRTAMYAAYALLPLVLALALAALFGSWDAAERETSSQVGRHGPTAPSLSSPFLVPTGASPVDTQQAWVRSVSSEQPGNPDVERARAMADQSLSQPPRLR
jgi:hypothetical protein